MTEDSGVIAVHKSLLASCKDMKRSPAEVFGQFIRTSLDEVIDGPRTSRWSLGQLAKTEKTYIGTKLEIVVRSALNLDVGAGTDVEIAGENVDIKWSETSQWMIGPQLIDKLCLGIGLAKRGAEFSVGVFRARVEFLRPGANQDKKRSLSAAAVRNQVAWVVRQAPLPSDFIAELQSDVRAQIFAGGSAQERIRLLGTLVPNRAIPRRAIMTVARDKDDPTRRLRKDAARHDPHGGMVWLSTKFGRSKLHLLGHRHLPRDHWIAVRAEDLNRVGA